MGCADARQAAAHMTTQPSTPPYRAQTQADLDALLKNSKLDMEDWHRRRVSLTAADKAVLEKMQYNEQVIWGRR